MKYSQGITCSRVVLCLCVYVLVQSKRNHSARVKGEVKISFQLKALYAKNKKKITHGAALTTDNGNVFFLQQHIHFFSFFPSIVNTAVFISVEISRSLTGSEDPTMFYEMISSTTLDEAFHDGKQHTLTYLSIVILCFVVLFC